MKAQTTKSNGLSADVERIYKQAISMCHADKFQQYPELLDEANKLAQQLNVARDKGDENAVKGIFNNLKYERVLVNYRAKLEELKADGFMKAEAMAHAQSKRWPKDKVKPLVDELWGATTRGGADKSDIVKLIIELEKQGKKASEIAKALAEHFKWSESTGKTVAAHIVYMHEYAKQVNHA